MQSGFVKRQLFFRRFMVFEATLPFTRFYSLELYRPLETNTVKLGCSLSLAVYEPHAKTLYLYMV